jgi:hypothetical protein
MEEASNTAIGQKEIVLTLRTHMTLFSLVPTIVLLMARLRRYGRSRQSSFSLPTAA